MNEIKNVEGGIQVSRTLLPSDHNDVNIALRNKIKERRKKKGLTFKKLEEHTGISAAELCKIENGQRQAIPLDTLKALSPYLGVSLDYLLSLVIPESESDHERFYDFDGKELDLFKIAKKLYNLDTELLLLLSDTKLLEERTDREIIKNYLKAVSMEKSLADANDCTFEKFIAETFRNFRNYCFKFLEGLVVFLKDGMQNKEGENGKARENKRGRLKNQAEMRRS